MQPRSRFLPFLPLLLLAGACTGAAAVLLIAGWFLIANRPVGPADPGLASEIVVEPAATRLSDDGAPTPIPTSATLEVDPATQSGPPVISADILDQMTSIERQVVEIRGLLPGGVFTRSLMSPDQLRERVTADFFADYTTEEAAEDALVLAAFGLLDPQTDLLGLYTLLFSEQVAGFYDNETKEMVVVQEAKFGGIQQLTYAHEYTHALQDQTYAMRDGLGYTDELCELDTERCAGIQALIEGDSTLVEVIWLFDYSSPLDQQEIFQAFEELDTSILDSAPAYLQKDFLFPYDQGFKFVQSLYDQGGFAAVDGAYRDLPVSTEQIIHPDRYPHDRPVLVELPDLIDLLGSGWSLLDANVLGEWYTYLVLAFGENPNARLLENEAGQAAEGWGGDRYAVYYNAESGQTAMVMATIWDTPPDAAEFAQAFSEHAGARYGASSADPSGALLWESASGVTAFYRFGDETYWVLAPDRATVMEILSSVKIP